MPQTLSDRQHLSALMDAPTTEHPEFKWNAKSQRYQYRQGGKFVPKAAFEKLTIDHITQKKAELRAIGERFADKGGFVQFQKDGFKAIKTTFTQQYLLGRGGLGRMEDSDYATLKKELRYQGKMWRVFAVDIKKGGMTRAQMQMRLAMYGEASKVAYFDGQAAAAKAAGMTEERNVLGDAEHCPSCLAFTAQGWKPFGTFPKPTKQRQCRIYCYCTMEYRKGRKRKDALPDIAAGLVKKVITNVEGHQQTVYVRMKESKTAALMETQAKKVWETDELPSRGEIVKIAATATREFFGNPIKAVNDGLKREKQAREAYALTFGREAPTKMQATKKAMQLAGKKLKDLVLDKETIVAGAGIAGSIVGGAVAGPAGALAADLGGTLIARKAVEAHAAYKKASGGLRDAEAFTAANALSKIKLKAQMTLSEMKTAEIQREMEKELVGDSAGWAIGNATAAVVGALAPGLSIVPLGAVAAISTVPTVVVPIATKAHNLRREGLTPEEAVKEAFSTEFMKGTKREKALRAEFTKRMKELKASAN